LTIPVSGLVTVVLLVCLVLFLPYVIRVINPLPTPTSTMTSTSTRTHTPTITLTETSSLTPTPTSTATPTDTHTPTATPTSTVTATPTATYTSSNTSTPLPTATPTNTATFTDTATYTPSSTFTATATYTSTLTPTYTLTWTPQPTETPIPTSTHTPTPTPIPAFTVTQNVGVGYIHRRETGRLSGLMGQQATVTGVAQVVYVADVVNNRFGILDCTYDPNTLQVDYQQGVAAGIFYRDKNGFIQEARDRFKGRIPDYAVPQWAEARKALQAQLDQAGVHVTLPEQPNLTTCP
jgi:hypothetical protein